jgi:hypothetical protein
MPKFSVDVSAMAVVRTCVEVQAADAKEAESRAIEAGKSGDVVWRYDGVEDDSLMAFNIEEEK